MQFDKWTTEGAVKSSSLESILQRNICVIDEECVGILLEITGIISVKQGGTAGLYTCPCKRTGVLFFKLGDGYLFCEHMPEVACKIGNRLFYYKKEKRKMLNLTLEEVKKYKNAYTAVPVCKELFADMTTPIAFLQAVRESSNNYFLLESLEGGEKWGRYSFVGYDPIVRIKAKDKVVEVKNMATVKLFAEDPIKCIRDILKEYKVPKIKGIPPLTGGFVGYFSYDFIQYCEPSLHFDPAKATEYPDFDLMLFDKIVAFDHLQQKIFIIVNVKTDNVDVNYHKAEREIKAIQQMLEKPINFPKYVPAKLGPMECNQTKEEYAANLAKISNYIKNGDIFQAVYSQQFSADYDQSLFNVYRLLRTSNPSQYMVFMKNDDVEIAGSSPETLVKVVDRTITSMPIAGTRPRGKTEQEDMELEAELLRDEKEVAEHNMLVDLGRNDVGRVSEFGSVKVPDYKVVNKFSQVMHITSRVTGTLKAGMDSVDALCSVFPAGTLSGAPKIRACEIIDELEPNRRGIYGGGMGYLDFAGNMDICITIRTAVKHKGKVYVQAGGGIVADSVPTTEYMETINKAGAVFKALEASTKER